MRRAVSPRFARAAVRCPGGGRASRVVYLQGRRPKRRRGVQIQRRADGFRQRTTEVAQAAGERKSIWSNCNNVWQVWPMSFPTRAIAAAGISVALPLNG